MIVYAVVRDKAVDFDTCVTYSLYLNKDKAIEAFNKAIEKEKEFWEIDEMDEETFKQNYVIESIENSSWTFYVIGEYSYMHSVISLEEKEIIE